MRLIGTSTSVARREAMRAALALTGTLHPRRLRLLRDVRRAVDAGELFCVFQPKAELATGTVVGCEALLRWHRPGRGTVPPADFLPAVEDSFVMPGITRHVLVSALAARATWEHAGVGVPVEVNLAARDLVDPAFCSSVRTILGEHGARPGVLGLEITENDILEDPQAATETVRTLHEMGVTVALDDFGTGYSSLARLRSLPIDEVKIDRSFVGSMLTDRGSASIVRATIDLAHDFGTVVIAEGVETEEIRDALLTLGCDRQQGYCLARPMRAGETLDWLRRRKEAVVAAAA